jgi:hypothetical protein
LVILFTPTQTVILIFAPTGMAALVLDVTNPLTPNAVVPGGHAAPTPVKADE